MSRIGKNHIVLPSGVEVTIDDERITVKAGSNVIWEKANRLVKIINDGGVLKFEPTDESPEAQAMWGTMRALVNNMVIGVTQGFERKLQLVGVGYRAQVQGRNLNLSLGFSHQIIHPLPEGIEALVNQTEIVLKGKSKQILGEEAAKIRGYRPPEPYKGKGVRYVGEVVSLKEVKKK